MRTTTTSAAREAVAFDRAPAASPPCWRALVAGVGRTAPVPADPRSIPEMVLEAVEAALADAAATLDEVEAVVTASADLLDGLTASNVAVTEVVGAVMRPETRIAGDGLAAAIHGACQVAAGAYETVLVVAHGKPSMTTGQDVTRWAMDPVHLQPLGVDFMVCSGLQAALAAHGDPHAPGRWARVAAQRLAAAGAAAPPCAEEVLTSPLLAAPLRRAMAAPAADAAAAVLLRGPAAAPGAGGVWLAGAGLDLDVHGPGERDLGQWAGLRRATARALSVAGVRDPTFAFDLLEPSCAYPHEEELFLAATGVAPGTLRSPSGGLFGGATPIVDGLGRLVAAVRWLRQRPRPGRALAHGTWGPAGQAHAVAVLEGGGA